VSVRSYLGKFEGIEPNRWVDKKWNREMWKERGGAFEGIVPSRSNLVRHSGSSAKRVGDALGAIEDVKRRMRAFGFGKSLEQKEAEKQAVLKGRK